jgi:hypothetical protein
MDVVTGALGMLPSKLPELLNHEYNKLQEGLRAKIQSLSRDLESMHCMPPSSRSRQCRGTRLTSR